MFEGDLALSLLCLVSGLVLLGIGAFVYLRNPFLRPSKLFLLMTVEVALASFADLLMLNAPDDGSASPWARVMVARFVGAFATNFYRITTLPTEKNLRVLADHKRSYAATSLLLVAIAVAAVDGVTASRFRFPAGTYHRC
jgi:hypothetical protein